MQRVIQHIYIIPLLISMLLSLKSFRLKWPAPYKTFSVLLVCISIVEIIAILWKYFLYDKVGDGHFSNNNAWIYNCFLIPQYLLYMYVYYQTFKSKFLKRTITAAGIFFALFTIANILFFQSIHTINSLPLIMAGIIMFFLNISYFEQLIREKEIIRLMGHPMVWISFGVFFQVATLPYMTSLNYLIRNNISLAVTLYYVYLGVNCVIYTLYSIAFLCRNPIHK